MRQAKRGEHRTGLSARIDPDSGYIKWDTDTDGNPVPENDTILPDRELPLDEGAQHSEDLVWCIPCGHVYCRDGITAWMKHIGEQRQVPCPLCHTAIRKLEDIGTKPTHPLYTRPMRRKGQEEQPMTIEEECEDVYEDLCAASRHWREEVHRRSEEYEHALWESMSTGRAPRKRYVTGTTVDRHKRRSVIITEEIQELRDHLTTAETILHCIEKGIIRNRANFRSIQHGAHTPGASQDNPYVVD